MKPELAALARHRLEQAHETLAEAEQLLASQGFRGAVNRLYYAAFYGARALLATRDVDAARHTGLITLFQQHFVKTGLMPAETGKVLARAFEKRQNSDYGDFATIAPPTRTTLLGPSARSCMPVASCFSGWLPRHDRSC